MMMEDDGRKRVEKMENNKVAGDHLGTLVGVPIAQKNNSDPKLYFFDQKKVW